MKNFTNFYSWWQNKVHGNFIEESEFFKIQAKFEENELLKID